jgi:hypothetical protein
MKKKKKPVFGISTDDWGSALETYIAAQTMKVIPKYVEDDFDYEPLEVKDHAITLQNIKTFDQKAKQGYRFNLLTEKFYKP